MAFSTSTNHSRGARVIKNAFSVCLPFGAFLGLRGVSGDLWGSLATLLIIQAASLGDPFVVQTGLLEGVACGGLGAVSAPWRT